MDFRPIETVYNGYRFRSRLEARWAVFFDVLGIKYDYEPEGFIKGSFRYLPDFYLPNTETWVEVKGNWKDQDLFGFVEFLDFGCPMHGFDNSAEETLHNTLTCPGLLVLGQIPSIKWGVVLHPLIRHYKGLVRSYVSFGGDDFIRKEEGRHHGYMDTYAQAYYDDFDGLLNFFDPEAYTVETRLAFTKVVNAYQAARQARFEHGQVGSPKRWAV